ncbi:ABSCISIC ACID-INSENSITIVE 5-like protein 6 [Cucurbita maxima]|uniref:ABSCISIC ACID-INSENSITIVE 5-like protein 6 n=1 Tax=Cucurbita maxima TaxID=3661 RepID=A0A6J1JE37_CUCMA|nr:ABSCISIC ACID-INSENSITIVE 5-like protein 6 [Cucurbita maxima]XP_022988816.1 ABSCISIC ACID-INSENSITIVE 5-like protein 6 [Cucurbita maxima]XP_022988817.1 ABSCISIC ACID-INSENSITIVE 5-like protein 6 [Cucurbita maxima]
MNFRNFEDMPPGNFTLARQPSIYSLTFDEIQNTWSGLGKEVGSMNMDELLKNIWTAEESQAMTSGGGGGGGGSAFGGNLQRQGSLTLPRTISQKTVDEVWKGLSKDNIGVEDGSGIEAMPRREPTLGEVTLEEFLVRAGVVREEPFNCGFYNQNAGSAVGMLMGNQMSENKNMVSVHNQNAALLGTGVVRPSQQQQQQPLFPKPATVTFASSMNSVNNPQLTNMVLASKPPLHEALIQGSGVGAIGLGSRGVTVASRSPTSTISSDVITKNSIRTSSYSPVPVPYSFGRGRRSSGALEKVVERRQRRMIKNRESAARSRARKQAYTMELEAEIAKLKEVNQELQNIQREIMETQKDKVLEKMKCQWGDKRLCLRRTLTGPW